MEKNIDIILANNSTKLSKKYFRCMKRFPYYWETITVLYQKCFPVGLEMFPGCTGNVFRLYGKCFPVRLEMFPGCTGNVFQLYGKCFPVGLEMFSGCTGNVSRLYGKNLADSIFHGRASNVSW
jgi:hypothetical protein